MFFVDVEFWDVCFDEVFRLAGMSSHFFNLLLNLYLITLSYSIFLTISYECLNRHFSHISNVSEFLFANEDQINFSYVNLSTFSKMNSFVMKA